VVDGQEAGILCAVDGAAFTMEEAKDKGAAGGVVSSSIASIGAGQIGGGGGVLTGASISNFEICSGVDGADTGVPGVGGVTGTAGGGGGAGGIYDGLEAEFDLLAFGVLANGLAWWDIIGDDVGVGGMILRAGGTIVTARNGPRVLLT
jgi:hypothetical protein